MKLKIGFMVLELLVVRILLRVVSKLDMMLYG
jgi:hypothetical protein